MNHQPDRDRSIEPLLRRSLEAGPYEATAACLDAEGIAAFVDGGLSQQEMASVRDHLADCARCQSLLAATARIEPSPDAEQQSTRRWLIWAVPLAAAAAVAGIYIALPRQPLVPATAPAVSDTASSAPTSSAPPPVSAPAPSRNREKQETDQLAKESLRKDAPQATAEGVRENSSELRREADASKADTPAAPAEPPAPAQARAANTLRDAAAPGIAASLAQAMNVDIASPDPLVRWRLAGSNVQRSTDGGQQWQLQTTGAAAPLSAGSAVSSTVVWVVGQRGTVLLSTDGQTWRRLTFADSSDLSGVRARDANSANVTTSDGRTYSTTDAGASWVPRPLQDF